MSFAIFFLIMASSNSTFFQLLGQLLHNFAQNVPRPLSGRVPGLSFSTLLILEPVAFTLQHDNYNLACHLQFFFSSWHHLTQPFFSFLANANQEATHRVIQAVVADHGGTDKCPWSSAEMKGNYTCRSLLLLTAMQPCSQATCM